jgi:hypothetical protein
MTDQPPEEVDDGQQVRPFAAVLQELDRGRVHDEASTKLHDLINDVIDCEKDGTLTIKIKVGPIAKNDVSVLVVSADVDSRPPKQPRTSAYFVDRSGNLTRRDPRQPEIPGLHDASAYTPRSNAQ